MFAWEPCFANHLWTACVPGRVLGYRDWAGGEAHPGTYDALANMLFAPLPTPGSSGGPIVDEQTGAVVGVIRGTRMDSAVEGLRGWAVPAEAIYEVRAPIFSLNENDQFFSLLWVWLFAFCALAFTLLRRINRPQFRMPTAWCLL